MIDRITDWIFAPQCAACGAPAVTLCGACRGSLDAIGAACPRCGEPTAEPGEGGGDGSGAGGGYDDASIAGDGGQGRDGDGGGDASIDGDGGQGRDGDGGGDASIAGDGGQARDGDGGGDASIAGRGGPARDGVEHGGTAGTARCRRCARDPLPLDRVVAPWRFGGQLASAIRRLKFGNRAHIARDLAPLWAPALAAAVAEHDALVVPVPLHWRRRWRRGYDHAWLLARHGCAFAGIAGPVAALRRVRHGPAQSTLAAAERAANVRGAFTAASPAIRGRAIVLVDDVMTTGATLVAAARALRGGGATSITAVVVARATFARG